MPDSDFMVLPGSDKTTKNGIFITFTGNCKKALAFYQTCFGGDLYFQNFPTSLPGYTDKLLISGSLISGQITIHGSDLAHDEGRTVGNYLSVFLQCNSPDDREVLLRKLDSLEPGSTPLSNKDQKLIEVRDIFDVTWILGV